MMFSYKKETINVVEARCKRESKAKYFISGKKITLCQFFILVPKNGNAKECSSYHTTEFTSHATKVMLKNLAG